MRKIDNLIITTKTRAAIKVDDFFGKIKSKKKGNEDLIGKVALILVVLGIIALLAGALKVIFYGSSTYNGSGDLAADSFIGKLKANVLGIFK